MNTEAVETTEKLNKPNEKVEAKTTENQENRRWDRGQWRWKKFRDDRWGKQEKPKKEYDELLLEVRRVTRVTTWWRRMSFRATVLVWNRKWKVGIWTSKWPDVTVAVQKAANEAYKNLIKVTITKASTVPYPTTLKYKACSVRLIPALSGTWLKAWSSVRSVLELAWYQNVLSKIMWSNNKLNNAIATVMALSTYKHADHFDKLLVKSGNDDGSTKKEVKEVEVKSDSENKVKDEVKKPVTKIVEKKTVKKTK